MEVMIVDDHPLFVDALSAIFTNINHSTHLLKAASVEHALEIIKLKPILDLIVLDLSLPGLDGLSFLKELNKQPVIIPVVVVSSSDDIVEIKQAFDFGIMGFIPKSYNSQQIEEAIKKILNGELVKPEYLVSQSPEFSDKQLKCLARLNLRNKQLQVLKLMAKGLSNKEIAIELTVTTHTVKAHAAKIFRNLNCETRVEAVLEASRLGLIDR